MISVKKTGSDITLDVIIRTLTAIIIIVVLAPLVHIIACSFSSPVAVMSSRVYLWPVDFSVKGYSAVFNNKQIWVGYGNSVFYTVTGTLINLIVTMCAAYPLSRKNVIYGKKYIMFLFTFTMLFSGGLIPSYLLIKNLGMLNTRWAMILPGALSVWNMAIAITYLSNTIPEELYEAAEIDGCKDLRLFVRVVLPLSGPILGVLGLFYAIAHWNAYFNALLYLKSSSLNPLQIILRDILIANQVDTSMISDIRDIIERQGMADLLKYSIIVVASIPALVIYPFIQKYFVKGVMVGSLKG
ncbi:MAG: carbohydrate ABC transporter permease [Treponema sp.]|nr:carbohydrate ABC transporter permease [Treponema sp.]